MENTMKSVCTRGSGLERRHIVTSCIALDLNTLLYKMVLR